MAGMPPTINDNNVTLTFGATHVYYGYCTIADVSFEFTNISSYSALTNSVIAQCITYAASELHQLIDPYYAMPYTGTNAIILLELRQINSWLACSVIVDRMMQGAEPDMSPWAEERRSWAELKINAIISGHIRWDTSVGADATGRAILPQYNPAAGATITPDPSTGDPINGDQSAIPLFSVGGIPRFNPNQVV